MKANQRKAKLKRAKQHQAYCKTRDNRVTIIKDLRDWNTYSESFAEFENYLERGNKWHQQAFNQLVIFLGVFFVVLLGLWWLAVRSA